MDRFWSKVAIKGTDECWPWLASCVENGYGHFQLRRRMILAHRMAYMLVHGDIPHGKHILHSCDNRLCCNPAHLHVGTNHENVKDKMQKGRHPRGSQTVRAKINEHDVEWLKRATCDGMPIKDAAARLGIAPSTASNILAGRRWAHVK